MFVMNTSSRFRPARASISFSSLPAAPDERPALGVFVEPGPLADEHDLGLRVALTGHAVAGALVQTAVRAGADFLGDERRAPATCGPPDDGACLDATTGRYLHELTRPSHPRILSRRTPTLQERIHAHGPSRRNTVARAPVRSASSTTLECSHAWTARRHPRPRPDPRPGRAVLHADARRHGRRRRQGRAARHRRRDARLGLAGRLHQRREHLLHEHQPQQAQRDARSEEAARARCCAS